MSLLALSDVSFAYSSGYPLFEGASFSVNPTDRIAIVGPNGAGKSTLLHLLTGRLEPVRGEIIRRNPLIVSSVGQSVMIESASTLFDFVFDAVGAPAPLRKAIHELEGRLSDASCATEYATLINEYGECGGYTAEAAVARVLGGLGWQDHDFERPMRSLSGGERTRAALARALSLTSDLLILDEPTNHLDIAAREWLEDYLGNRQAATVFTSHDRALLEAVASRIIEVERGVVRLFEGGFPEYRESRALLTGRPGTHTMPSNAGAQSSNRRRSAGRTSLAGSQLHPKEARA
jgi:ATPase subunit of ABC transporter with duplicated ATPase domains